MSKIDLQQANVAYASEAQILCDWIDTTNFVVVGGRGMAKSTVIMARRSLRCVREMPGAPIAIVADSYTNLVNNIMPAVQNGWKLCGLIEGVHYIKSRKPPEKWRRRCSVIVDDYKHVYSFWNGSVIFLGSLDSPSLLAGKSVAHLLFDEAKYASETRASRVMPILRGDAITYGHCHLYGGVTITTDMPDVTEGEYDWFCRYAAEMDPPTIIKIVQAAALRNDVLIKIEKEKRRKADSAKVAKLENKLTYYDNGLRKMRKGATFFANLSSFANIDILTLDYAKRLWNGALEPHEFMKSVMGMRPGVRRDARFYALFSDTHKYLDGTYSGEAAHDCTELRYLRSDMPLEGGMDFGNMMSLVIAQGDGPIYRIHKCIYEIPPGWLREVADKFLDFFAPHKCKTLRLFYDRAANAYQAQGQDMAAKIKEAIERDANGMRTGWTVDLMSRGQATILQGAEYDFMHELLEGKNRRLPILKVDALNCVEMICSIEGAKAEIRYKAGVKYVGKVKRTEKLEPKKLPRLSTNFSDAFKYLMMRGEWVRLTTATRKASTGAASMFDKLMTDKD